MKVLKSYDNLAKIVTVGVWAGVLYIFINNIFTYKSDPFRLLITNAILIAVLVIPYLFSPKSFLITKHRIIIKKGFGEIKIPLKDIAEVKQIPRITKIRLRLLGSTGLYGYFGYFYIPDLGLVRMYATRLHDLLLIRYKDKTYIISPENTFEFIEKYYKAKSS